MRSLASKKYDVMGGGTTMTYGQLVFQALDRINSLSGGENTSYNPWAHESCINSLWFMIPLAKKRQPFCPDEEGGETFEEIWDGIIVEYQKVLDTKELRDEQTMTRICRKQQLLTECLYSLDLLFDAPDADKMVLWERGE